MTRDELIEAGLQAVLVEANHLGRELTFRDELVVMIDAIEPLIRADERDIATNVAAEMMNEAWTNLRAQVEALRDEFGPEMPSYWVLRQVLALIDGGSDG